MSSSQEWRRRRRDCDARSRAGGRRRLRPDVLMLEDRRLMTTIIPVTSVGDTGSGTLRDAFAQAATTAGPVEIDFQIALPATIRLTQGQLELSDTGGPVSIVGPGAAELTIDGGGESRVLLIDPNVVASISGLTIADGSADSSGEYFGGGVCNAGTITLDDCAISSNDAGLVAGALYNAGTATLDDCTVSGNRSTYGGGVLSSGALSLVNCRVSGNSAAGGAGGVSSYGTMTAEGCTFSGNFSAGLGLNGGAGGIEAAGLTTTIVDCVISGNNSWIFGGGINVEGGDATIEGCRISGNSAGFAGGGLTVVDSHATVRGCDFLDNAAGEYGGGACVGSGSSYPSPGSASISGCRFDDDTSGQYGGGIAVTAGSLTIADSAITGNSAASEGGGLFTWDTSYGGSAKLTMQGMTVGGNTAPRAVGSSTAATSPPRASRSGRTWRRPAAGSTTTPAPPRRSAGRRSSTTTPRVTAAASPTRVRSR